MALQQLQRKLLDAIDSQERERQVLATTTSVDLHISSRLSSRAPFA
jgi:hypothetical protein